MAVLIIGGLLALVIFGYSILGLIFDWEKWKLNLQIAK